MPILTSVLDFLIPLLSFILLLLGILQKRLRYVIATLWLTVLAVYLQYEAAGGEILGNYFTYQRALLYSINLILLVTALIYVCINIQALQTKYMRYLSGFIIAFSVTASIMLMINLWANAYFLSQKLPNTAIFQVSTMQPNSYCSFRYVFYEVSKNGKVKYLCPNHYGLIPSIGELEVAPDFLVNQFARENLSADKP